MFRRYLALGILSVAGLMALTSAGRSEETPKGTPEQATKERKEAHARLDKLILAYRLIALADSKDKDQLPESKASALLLAAELLYKADATPAQLKSAEGQVTDGKAITPEALIAQARELKPDSQVIKALADSTAKLIKEGQRGDGDHRPTSFSGDIKGQGIYERSFVSGRPAAVYAYCPGGQVVTIKVMNTDTVPPTVIGEQTGSNIRIEWTPGGPNRLAAHKIFITPGSPVPFFITWATN